MHFENLQQQFSLGLIVSKVDSYSQPHVTIFNTHIYTHLRTSVASCSSDTLRPQQNGGRFAENIFKYIFMIKELFWFKFNWIFFLRANWQEVTLA